MSTNAALLAGIEITDQNVVELNSISETLSLIELKTRCDDFVQISTILSAMKNQSNFNPDLAFVQTLFRLSSRLIDQYEKNKTELITFMINALLKAWNSSEVSMRSIQDQIPVSTSTFKNEIDHEIIFIPNVGFSFGNDTYVDSDKLQVTQSIATIKKLHSLSVNNSRFFYIQGIPGSIKPSIFEFEQLDHESLSFYLNLKKFPPKCTCGSEEEVKEMTFNPDLIFISPVLKRILSSNMLERENNTILLPTIPPHIFEDILLYLESPEKFLIPESHVVELYTAADYLEITSLINRCKIKIIRTLTNYLLVNKTLKEFEDYINIFKAFPSESWLYKECELFIKKMTFQTTADVQKKLLLLLENGIYFDSLELNLSTHTKEIVELVFKNQSKIKSLKITFSDFEDVKDQVSKLEHLKELKELTHLDLSNSLLLNDQSGLHLSQLSQLQTLNLSGCTQLTEIIGISLLSLKNLSSLNIQGCSNIGPKIMVYIDRLKLSKCLIPAHINI